MNNSRSRIARLITSAASLLCSTTMLVVLYPTASFTQVKDTAPQGDICEDLTVEPIPITHLDSLIHYPARARRRHLEGKVIVAALINADGDVDRVEVEKSTDTIFNRAAMEACLRMKYHPGEMHYLRVSVWWTMPVIFRLKKYNHE